MKVSYYPGCSLQGTAKEYGESTEAICGCLDIELEVLEDWNCCGASCAHGSNDILAITLPARNLALAEKYGQKDLITPCAACYQRLKVAEKELANKPQSITYIIYQGTLRIWHLLDFLHDAYSYDKIKAKIKKPLSGLKTVCYYGCLTVRPPRITDARDYENPQKMDQLMMVLGAEALSWSYKTDCCGASLVLTHPEIVMKLTEKIVQMAREAGADAVVVGCPLCHSNLEIYQKKMTISSREVDYLPVFFFTELAGLALGHPDVSKWFDRHLVDPMRLLNSKGLM